MHPYDLRYAVSGQGGLEVIDTLLYSFVQNRTS
jgi:hypothetical protein